MGTGNSVGWVHCILGFWEVGFQHPKAQSNARLYTHTHTQCLCLHVRTLTDTTHNNHHSKLYSRTHFTPIIVYMCTEIYFIHHFHSIKTTSISIWNNPKLTSDEFLTWILDYWQWRSIVIFPLCITLTSQSISMIQINKRPEAESKRFPFCLWKCLLCRSLLTQLLLL